MEYCANAAAPLETKIKRHIYATLNSQDVIKIISLEAETAAEIRPPAIFNLIKNSPSKRMGCFLAGSANFEDTAKNRIEAQPQAGLIRRGEAAE